MTYQHQPGQKQSNNQFGLNDQSIGKVCQARLDKNEIHYSSVRPGVHFINIL